MRKILVVLAACGMIAAAGSVVHAACTFPLSMQDDQAFAACTDYTLDALGNKVSAQVSAFAYQLSSPSTCNTGREDIASEFVGSNQSALGGDPTDGVVQIDTNWGNGGVVGCPIAGTTINRIVIAVQCADGKGFMASLAGTSGNGYNVLNAHKIDLAAGIIFPLQAGDQAGKPTTYSLSPDGTLLTMTFRKPVVFNDCDSDAYGAILPDLDCSGFTPPTTNFGRVLQSNQPCGTKPDPSLALWTQALDAAGAPAAIDPVTGITNVRINKPASGCLFVGSTSMIGGQETSGITGFVPVGGVNAASPVAEAVRAARKNGKLEVSWKTSSELNLAGFRVFAIKENKSELQLGAMVSPLGAGGAGASYAQSYALSDLRGAKSVVIESALADGSKVRSAPVAISN